MLSARTSGVLSPEFQRPIWAMASIVFLACEASKLLPYPPDVLPAVDRLPSCPRRNEGLRPVSGGGQRMALFQL